MSAGYTRTSGLTSTGRRVELAGAAALQCTAGVSESFAGGILSTFVAIFAGIEDTVTTNRRTTRRGSPTTDGLAILEFVSTSCSRRRGRAGSIGITIRSAVRSIGIKLHTHMARVEISAGLTGLSKLARRCSAGTSASGSIEDTIALTLQGTAGEALRFAGLTVEVRAVAIFTGLGFAVSTLGRLWSFCGCADMSAAKRNTIQATGAFVGIGVTLPASEVRVGCLEDTRSSGRRTRAGRIVASRSTVTFGVTRF